MWNQRPDTRRQIITTVEAQSWSCVDKTLYVHMHEVCVCDVNVTVNSICFIVILEHERFQI